MGARGYYRTPLHRQPAMAPFGGGVAELPATEELARTNLALPMSPTLGASRSEEVVAAVAGRGAAVRVWIDLTNSPHVLVMRPVIATLRERGHEVHVTARDFAQTLGLCGRFGIAHTAIGRHRGGGLAAKARGLAARSAR